MKLFSAKNGCEKQVPRTAKRRIRFFILNSLYHFENEYTQWAQGQQVGKDRIEDAFNFLKSFYDAGI